MLIALTTNYPNYENFTMRWKQKDTAILNDVITFANSCGVTSLFRQLIIIMFLIYVK